MNYGGGCWVRLVDGYFDCCGLSGGQSVAETLRDDYDALEVSFYKLGSGGLVAGAFGNQEESLLLGNLDELGRDQVRCLTIIHLYQRNWEVRKCCAYAACIWIGFWYWRIDVAEHTHQ